MAKKPERTPEVPFKLELKGERIDYVWYRIPKFAFTAYPGKHLSGPTPYTIDGHVSVFPVKRDVPGGEYQVVATSPYSHWSEKRIRSFIKDKEIYERMSFYISSRWINQEDLKDFKKPSISAKKFVETFLEEIVKQERVKLPHK